MKLSFLEPWLLVQHLRHRGILHHAYEATEA